MLTVSTGKSRNEVGRNYKHGKNKYEILPKVSRIVSDVCPILT